MKLMSCTRRHLLPDGGLTLLGSTGRVTPTMTLVAMGEARVLIDCGSAPPSYRIPQEALDVETVLLTHAHNDHISGLPRLLKEGRVRYLLATRPTLEIAELQAKDSIRLSGGSDADYRAFKSRFDAVATPVGYDTWRELEGGAAGVSVAFFEAGHILGSASIELRSKKSRVIVSGDLGRPSSPILRDYNTTWDDHRPVDLVLLETTYGDREQPCEAADLTDKLERAILHALEDGGHILVPAFAVGRTQVLLYHLNALVEAGRLPDLPVAVDTPMGLRVTETYKRFRRLYDKDSLNRLARGDDPIDFDGLYAVPKGSQSRRLDDLEKPMLIIAGSGMCTGGRILDHLINLLPRPETDVIFVGHQAKGTLGRVLQKMGEAREQGMTQEELEELSFLVLDEQYVAVRANITTLEGISAHADRRELADWLDHIPQVRNVALHHGNRDAQEGFREYWDRSAGAIEYPTSR